MLRVSMLCASGLLIALAPTAAPAQSWIDWRSKDNLATVGASAVEKEYVLTALSQPGGLYYPGEKAEITLAAPGNPQEPIDGASLELVNVHNRNAAPGEVGFVLVTVAPKVLKGDQPPARVKLDAFKPADGQLKVVVPLPAEYGTHMILLERKDGKRTFVGSVARVHKPVERRGEYPQIMAESGISNWSRLDQPEGAEQLAATYERMGIKFVRWEFHWSQDGQGKDYNWGFMDIGIPALERHGIKMLNTMGAQPGWTMPLGGGPIPSALHTENHISARKYDADFAKWVRAFVGRYWKGGQAGLWAIEHYNEPWEPVSCAGWQSDSCRYRELLDILTREAHSTAPGIKIAAACSIMNTEDKLASDGSEDRIRSIDLFTDHYVTPACSYGARVAAKYGKVSGETETWGVCSEVLLPQFMTQFLAIGNRWVNPMTGDMPLEELGGQGHPLITPKPLVAAVSAWNAIVADRPFERIAFTTHLPWLYQFGPSDDARFVLYGKTMPLASGNVRDVVWRQAADGPDGAITITDPQSALVVMDLEGNALKPAADKTYQLPMTPTGFYLQSDRGANYVIQCVQNGKLEGLRHVEILPGTITSVATAGKPLELPVRIRDLRNVPISGELKVASLLKEKPLSSSAKIDLKAGETTIVKVPVAALPAGGLPLRFEVITPAGTDRWQEVVRSTAIPQATLALDDKATWDKLPVTMVIRSEGQDAGDPIERAWLPFLEKRESSVPAKHGEVRLAWDAKNFYVQSAIESEPPQPRDRFEGWNQDQYFYSAKTDEICERLRPFEVTVRSRPGNPNDKQGWEYFKKLPGYADLMKYLETRPEEAEVVDSHAAATYFDRKARNPSATYADASFVYMRDISKQHPFAGDCFQFAFDVDPADQWATSTHDLAYPQDKLPVGFQDLPDTDYEFSLYNCQDGGSELMCLLSPGMPRVHVYPRQPRGNLYPHPEKEARSSVAYENGRVVYRAALPWKAVGVEKPTVGMNFGFTFEFNASQGDRTCFGEDVAATKSNSLSLHPYWTSKPSNTIRWVLAE